MESKIYKETCCSCNRCMVYEMKHPNCYKRELEELRSQLAERSHSGETPTDNSAYVQLLSDCRDVLHQLTPEHFDFYRKESKFFCNVIERLNAVLAQRDT